MSKLALPDVTLCAAASVNVRATVVALKRCLDQVDFADCILFTSEALPQGTSGIRSIPIEKLSSGRDYSEFVLTNLVDFITSSHCLVAQWDGFVVEPKQWDPGFLACDYIGAPWPQFTDRHDVGNGGFSLRSRTLLQACRDPRFQVAHPEDVAICRINRNLLEREHGIRFADHSAAARFSFERGKREGSTFGFHGIFNMIPLLGAEAFWEVYRQLDDRSTAFADYWLLMRQLAREPKSYERRARLTMDRCSALFGT